MALEASLDQPDRRERWDPLEPQESKGPRDQPAHEVQTDNPAHQETLGYQEIWARRDRKGNLVLGVNLDTQVFEVPLASVDRRVPRARMEAWDHLVRAVHQDPPESPAQ